MNSKPVSKTHVHQDDFQENIEFGMQMCVANEIAAPHHLQYIPPIRQLQGFQNHYVRRKPVERKMMRKVSERDNVCVPLRHTPKGERIKVLTKQ